MCIICNILCFAIANAISNFDSETCNTPPKRLWKGRAEEPQLKRIRIWTESWNLKDYDTCMVSHRGHNCIFDASRSTRRRVEWTRCQVEMTLRQNILLYFNVRVAELKGADRVDAQNSA